MVTIHSYVEVLTLHAILRQKEICCGLFDAPVDTEIRVSQKLELLNSSISRCGNIGTFPRLVEALRVIKISTLQSKSKGAPVACPSCVFTYSVLVFYLRTNLGKGFRTLKQGMSQQMHSQLCLMQISRRYESPSRVRGLWLLFLTS